jgi:hypothetical protein
MKEILNRKSVDRVIAKDGIGEARGEGRDRERAGEENRRLVKIVFSTPIRLQRRSERREREIDRDRHRER